MLVEELSLLNAQASRAASAQVRADIESLLNSASSELVAHWNTTNQVIIAIIAIIVIVVTITIIAITAIIAIIVTIAIAIAQLRKQWACCSLEHHKSGHRSLCDKNCDGDDDALDGDDQNCNDQNENDHSDDDHTSRELTQLILLVVIMW